MSMSKETPNLRFPALRNAEANENNGHETTPFNPLLCFPPPRTPLNAIADPAQTLSLAHKELLFDSQSHPKAEAFRGSSRRFSLSERKLDRVPKPPGSEPSSTQSTPSKNGHRASLGGANCASSSSANVARALQLSSRVSKGIPVGNSEFSVIESPQHFELEEDPCFWADHNVQVLIRIRPPSAMERIAQGYGRCLRQESGQSLVWLGHPETRFTFDHVACETISQESLFRVAGLPMVENCLSGYNSCMFAYGQTGSGKTYTMMGEIFENEVKLNEDCGLTPRIFEYLFKRIMAEEVNRRDEQLKYSCKCSFLEIYNEHITDLLEPSSNNLQLREDLKKGIHVENLTEYIVTNVNDVLQLLLQGAANRKVAATHMNSESSRSHSVLTCTVESRWVKDSTTHFRFARLNLVDLAGSERQKSSGAEGDRLKEAANINKSLSTLGLVIMSLVDLAHGKQRHVPYRDSRLTFLLQDSLGGNSKTTIIANISPSICASNETHSTLKFAQRAKLIQNNAKVNEDTSGDVNALQRQIQELKGQLSFLMKHGYLPRSLPSRMPSSGESRLDGLPEEYSYTGTMTKSENHVIQHVHNKIKFMEDTLAGALRREKLAESALQKLEAELEHTNCLAREREEEAQHSKMMLQFRDEEIKRLEYLKDGLLSAESYLVQENEALIEEIQLLQAGMDGKPKSDQYAVENSRLREQLQQFQNFYDLGEREILLAEVSELRNQLLDMLEGKAIFSTNNETQPNDTSKELEDCKVMNSNLIREVEELRMELRKNLNQSQTASGSATDSFSKGSEVFRMVDECSMFDSRSMQSDAGDDITSHIQTNDEALNNHMDKNVDGAPIISSNGTEDEFMDAAGSSIEVESKHVHLDVEKQNPQKKSCSYMENPSNRGMLEERSILKSENRFSELGDLHRLNHDLVTESSNEIDRRALQTKLDRMANDLEEVRLLNSQFQEEQELQLSSQQEAELVREQVEMETARTILQLQEEVAELQCNLDEKLGNMTRENMKLKKIIATKDEEVKAINTEWERATLELTGFLVDGSRCLRNVSSQIESIACSFPKANVWISEHVERAARVLIEKEETILQLKRSLEDAQSLVIDMGQKLSSLKGATMALTELQNLNDDEISKEHISQLLSDKIHMIQMLEKKFKLEETRATEAEKHASVAFIVMNWLLDRKKVTPNDLGSNIPIFAPQRVANRNILEAKADKNVLELEDAMMQIKLALLGVIKSGNTTDTYHADTDMYIAALQTTVQEISFGSKESIQNLVKEIHDIREKYIEFRDQQQHPKFCTVDTQSMETHKYRRQEDQYHMLHQLRDEISITNCRLKVIEDFVLAEVNAFEYSSAYGVAWSPDCSSLSSEFSTGTMSSGNMADASPFTAGRILPEKISEQTDLKFEDPTLSSHHEAPENLYTPSKSVTSSNTARNFLKKELEVLFDDFNAVHVRLAAIVNELNLRHASDQEVLRQVIPSSDSMLEKANLGSHSSGKGEHNDKIEHARSFLKKFEEVHATVKEADLMLNALVQANENSKQLSSMWKRNGEELMIERTKLIEEVEYLRSSICAKENENQLLNDEASCSMQDIANSISLLEESYQQIKSEEEKLMTIYSDIFSMGMEMVHFISNTRSFLEDICSKILEKDFCSFVVYRSYIGQLINEIPRQDAEPVFYSFSHVNKLQKSNGGNKIMNFGAKTVEDMVQAQKDNSMGSHMSLSNDDLMYDNLALKKELKRKEDLLDGLLFDFSLLQESTSITKDIKDETEKLVRTLSQVRYELEEKTRQFDELLVHHQKLKCHLADTQEALVISNASISQANEMIESFSEQNSELKVLVQDLYVKKSEVEEQLDEQKEVVQSLEEEILQLGSSSEKKFLLLVEDIEDNLIKVTSERDQLNDDIRQLKDKLEMTYAIIDEKEAIIIEARQESKESKIYAEQKEEEVKILEHSIEELESTINVLENKVYEMDAEVERHKLIRDSLESELKALKQRLLTVENLTENVDSENKDFEYIESQMFRPLQSKDRELHQAQTEIMLLKEERAEQDNEIKQYKEYVNEIMLHAEAQASQYQQKYKTLEAMVREVKTDSINSASIVSASETTEKTSSRARGSSSPFRCIGGFVQQANLERNQELSAAKLRIEELETLVANRQKEICMLNTRLAAAESMTHDVIRDLLGVKLDVTNFANMIDEYQVKKLMESALQQTEDILEKEVVHLRKQLSEVIEERESCVLDLNKRGEDLLAAQIAVEQLQERDRLLSAQNEMLKMDKSNLKKKMAELDEMIKALVGPKSTQDRTHQTSLSKNSLRIGNVDLAKRLEQSEKLLSRVNGELAQFYKPTRDRTSGHGLGTSYRKKGQAG